MTAEWKLRGFDTFSNEYYPLAGSYPTEQAAIEAAQARLDHLERTQPTSSSGGQGPAGIQDRVFIVGPDGGQVRYLR